MNAVEHKKRHEDLHKSFDQLLADFLIHNPGKVPSTTTVMELIEWSYQQTLKPTPGYEEGLVRC